MPRVKVRLLIAGCLVAPFVALLGVPWYARQGPVLWGVPFFYWYQLLWIPLTVILMTVAYLLSQPRQASDQPRQASDQSRHAPDRPKRSWDQPEHPWEDHRDHHDQ